VRSLVVWAVTRRRISRELRRNASTRTNRLEYKASIAQWHAERRARRPKIAKLVGDARLREYVQERLSGVVRTVDGRVAGPAGPAWKGRNKPHRGDRRWVTSWSPEQIANRLELDFPDDESMRISHEAIYQALYVEGRGALKRELVACLRTGRALRVPRARSRQQAWAHVTDEVLISERPAEAEDRAVPGHWEGDLIIGLQRSAIGTLVERTTRFTILIHLPREKGYGATPRTKNGPPLAGYGAITMKNRLAEAMTTLPEQLRRSLTWDRGKELSAHTQFKIETGTPVFFADPHSPWQRGTNENANGRRPSWHRLHLPAYTLSFLANFFKPPQRGTTATNTRTFLWEPGMRKSVLTGAAVEEPAFTAFMDSYATVARPALERYGWVPAAPQLPGARTADLRAGRTIVEVKTGWLTGDDEPDRLVDQLLGYGLLSQLTNQPARYVAAYLARYETIRRYRFDNLATRCLRTRPNTITLAREYLARHEQRTP